MGDQINTVRGPISKGDIGLADAHGHLWISSLPSQANTSAPVLDDLDSIQGELAEFYQAGGRTVVDCQPGSCGRDANQLVNLSLSTNVNVIACTGFHLKRYYPEGHWLWSTDEQTAQAYFEGEIVRGVAESDRRAQHIHAGVLKIALTDMPDLHTIKLMRAAARTSRETGISILVHTERGAWAEELPRFFEKDNIDPARLIISHLDKRPDFQLHSELARSGALLVYDTFLRTKYWPEQNVWPLIEKMVAAGLEGHLALGLDAAERNLWRFAGGQGITYLPEQIVPRLSQMGLSHQQVRQLTGENLARALSAQ